MVDRVTTSEMVFRHVRDAIISGELDAGSQHSIYGLAEQLGVSRTPVRDAMLRLSDAGLVSIERNRGIRIRGLSVTDVRSIFELRLMIEVPAAGVAAASGRPRLIRSLDEELVAMERAIDTADAAAFFEHDRRLHSGIIDAFGNERASHVIAGLRDSTQIMGASTLDGFRTMHDIRSEHLPVIDAIRTGDQRAAAAAMASHLVNTGSLLMTQAAERGGGEFDPAWAERLVPFLVPQVRPA